MHGVHAVQNRILFSRCIYNVHSRKIWRNGMYPWRDVAAVSSCGPMECLIHFTLGLLMMMMLLVQNLLEFMASENIWVCIAFSCIFLQFYAFTTVSDLFWGWPRNPSPEYAPAWLIRLRVSNQDIQITTCIWIYIYADTYTISIYLYIL